MIQNAIYRPRAILVFQQLLTAKCECGNPKKQDCFKYTPDRQAWCWPCTMRWADHPNAMMYIAPKDDVIQAKTIRGRKAIR